MLCYMLLPSCTYGCEYVILPTQVARCVEEIDGEEEAYGGEEKADESVVFYKTNVVYHKSNDSLLDLLLSINGYNKVAFTHNTSSFISTFQAHFSILTHLTKNIH